ncbi:NADPH-dependent diflavin oxidoreductase 1 isoform X1 [Cryptomeria japonica]|uniref:NADPH-dependent diflavin oxidoreductase 1 isoform X1 n=1 Tax=Cryptomeria japonica TaxID=3369 RepID=UPI0027D9E3F5|nr:NADPH-dependent diflavin oxidoreductase 1 isoform X1 [Cryptomeria japonica]XP_057850065.2 NADPH-dependent diflavin oxidoreductase 1 isoform X1 [Cryptomeria japonica]XP_057850066.2 NADPH-dependent diflavin oxidoreductase 1 isoform X1 [Cryptomeria japonica]
MEDKHRLLVLYASQTGNAQDVAERIGREAERRQCNLAVLSMEDFDVCCLPHVELVVFVVSTTGQGDPPDSMKEFWKFLLMRSLGHQWLERTRYALFGLGDSGYQKFNMVAKKLDKRLSDLGAHPIIGRGLGDDQHRSGYEAALDPWLTSLWATVEENFPHVFGEGMVLSDIETNALDLPKFQITYHDNVNDELLYKSSMNKESGIQDNLMECLRARAMIETANNANKSISKSNSVSPPQCFAHMIENKRLTGEDYERDVRHIEFELGCSDSQYETGDVLEVMPSQNVAAVDAFIGHCGLDPDAYITVEQRKRPNSSSGSDTMTISCQPVKLRTLVESTLDIASASPRRYFFEVMSHFATAEHEKERLQYFASTEGRDDLYQYNQKERRTVIEVLEDFPSVRLPLEWLLQLVPRLRTRMFSISSSLLAHPNQVHITVAVVSWMTPYKRKRHGLCSSWLAGLDPRKENILIPMRFHRGALKPPPPSIPLVLVGPGTGCAPFRTFIEQRALLRAVEPVAPILFFFGCRNEAKDFLYKDFWLSNMASDGVLSQERGGGFFVAFSRDQPQKVYVQHKMQEESRLIWNLLKSGAWVYVAGSATKMPTEVMSTIEEIISREGGFSKESASRWLRQLEKAGRYHVEAWS